MLERLKITIGNSRFLERLSRAHVDPLPGATIAVHLPNHLGDNVMAIPMVHSLVKDRRFEVILLSRPEYAELWAATGYPARLVEIPRVSRETFRAALGTLKGVHISHSILLATGEEIAWLHLRAGVPNRIGYDFWGRGFLLTKRLASGGLPTHESLTHQPMMRNYLALLEAVSIPESIPAFPWIDMQAEKDDTIAVSISASSPTRVLPATTMVDALVTVCRETGMGVRLLGVGRHEALVDTLRARGIAVEDLGGRTTVGDLLRALSRARAFVGPDSGTAHAAAAVGTPCLTLFTSGAPAWSSPIGPNVELIESKVPCSPCFGKYTCAGRFDCLSALDSATIAEALLELMAR